MKNTLQISETTSLTQALAPVISMWSDATTDATSNRRRDLIRNKSNAVLDFFQFTDKEPANINPLDVKQWQAELEKNLSPSSVYAKVSRVSSFYKWLIENGYTDQNPVNVARPKAPKAYQNESAKALSDSELTVLAQAIRANHSIVGKRDWAIFQFLLKTGLRRNEVLSLKWGDVKTNGVVVITTKQKGGDYATLEVRDNNVKEALIDYLKASGRLNRMTPDSPLWVAQGSERQMTSHAFALQMKKYASQAGLDSFHIHQLRHTFGRIASEVLNDLSAVQQALGHKNIQTTRVYVKKVGLKRDKVSDQMAERLGF